MSQTYNARKSHSRLNEIHKTYEDLVETLRDTPARQRKFINCCPFCGVIGELMASVKVGAKKRVHDVRLTPEGYDIPARGKKTCEILIIQCANCKVDIDPMAYLSPIPFLEERRIIDMILSS